MKDIKWKTIIGLIIIYLATIFDWTWMWGLLFWYWAIPGLFSGETYFMERVGRKEEPILFWVIMVSWVLIGGFFMVVAFY